MERISIADVARRAGVSEMTVSRVMNGKQYVAEATRSKVMAAVEALGYHPNKAAQSLSSQRTYIIAVVVDTGSTGDVSFREMVTGLEEALGNEGYSLLLHSLRREPHYGSYLYQSRQVDGVVVLSGPQVNREEIAVLHGTGMPYVMVGRRAMQGGIQTVFVSPDYAAAYAEATRHLLDLGHRRIGYWTDHLSFEPNEDRLEGVRRAMEPAGLKPVVYDGGGLTAEEAEAAMKRLLSSGITAVLAASTYDTLLAVRCARELGLSIPEDLSVVGFDYGTQHSHWAALTSQQLSAVIMPARDLGILAAETLLERLQGVEIKEPRLLNLPFVKGDSTSAPRIDG